MNITDSFLLPADVLLTPVTSLSPEQRRLMNADEEDFVVTRVHGRSRSKVVDAGTADLVKRFERATTIVEAVVAFSRVTGQDPEAVLEAAYPALAQLIRAGLLVPSGSESAAAATASLDVGDSWDGFEIVGLVQLLEDSEIYRARDASGASVALKIARPQAVESLAGAISREATILQHLDGTIAPALVKAASVRQLPYLATQWRPGVSGARAAAALRSAAGSRGRRGLLDLCIAIADAYTELHRRAVIHGDVHPGNLLVDEGAIVSLIDFGMGRLTIPQDGPFARARRGGVGYFFEPEYARAWLGSRKHLPLASFAGEQHVVAHLLYRLVTGHGFLEFSSERDAALRQLATGEPRAFTDWGLAAWPDLEDTLRRALSPDPEERFASMAEFASALRGVQAPEGLPAMTTSPRPAVFAPDERLVDEYLRRFDPAEPLFASPFPQVPRCSVFYGSGGVAYFLYRLAAIREDARILSWAKLWIEKALAEVGPSGDRAFYLNDGDLPSDLVGPVAVYHTMSGLWMVRAVVAKAVGDIPGQTDSIAGFADAVRAPCENIDLTLGRSGVLLGCALLTDALGPDQRLREEGDAVLERIWAELDATSDILREKTLRYTGIAHGWAGVLYAALTWWKVTNRSVPESTVRRLDELAALAEPRGRNGLQWTRVLGRPGREPQDAWRSWCNGSAGMIFLWTLAHEMTTERRYLRVAEGAAWDAIEDPEIVPQLCCGRPGQTYGVLNLFKHTGDERWLEHARRMTEATVRAVPPSAAWGGSPLSFSLYKGPLGVALLSADMASAPQDACMPFFEREGWRP